jgi:hypothetical protein
MTGLSARKRKLPPGSRSESGMICSWYDVHNLSPVPTAPETRMHDLVFNVNYEPSSIQSTNCSENYKKQHEITNIKMLFVALIHGSEVHLVFRKI